MTTKTVKNSIKKLVLSALFIAIGIVLPFFTGQIPQVGNFILPMHIPVFLCGLICSWNYGLAVGFILPLLRSFLFGAPPLYPNAIAMCSELAVYGLVCGFIYNKTGKQNIKKVYISMIVAMLVGRAVWGAAEMALLGVKGNTFTVKMFLAGAFIEAIPGIILQLVLIPAIIFALDRSGIHTYKSR
ncbi:MAG: ECF transporter S component [Ruminococcus sp.]|nr:ECF transporter S component [Ruminococcus sp.]